MHGSVERIATPPSRRSLDGRRRRDGVRRRRRHARARPAVSCPTGANDFPVPADNPSGPSPRIDHVFFIVRENKNFDALFGDFAGVDGEPTYTLKNAQPGQMDVIWHNLRIAARDVRDQRQLLHRRDLLDAGPRLGDVRPRERLQRAHVDRLRQRQQSRVPFRAAASSTSARPLEGSLFDWLGANGVPYDILGEIAARPTAPPIRTRRLDIHYPGGPFQNIGYNDLEKACYAAGRCASACDLGQRRLP